MPGVFLSHSSADKVFVTKLAIDLIQHDIPVWFDTWELELGQSLSKRIFEGLDQSTTVLVLLSPSALNSNWVRKEMEGALIKEERLQKTFVIPIKIAECEIPLELAGKLYADFPQKGYLASVEHLSTLLKKRGADKFNVSPERQLLPAVFSQGEHLNKIVFQARANKLCSLLPQDYSITQEQVIISPDECYTLLRNTLLRNLETIHSRSSYTPKLEEYIQYSYQEIQEHETALVNGLALAFNTWRDARFSFSLGEVAYWFGRMIKNMLLSRVWSAQLQEDPDPSEYGKNCLLGPMGDNHSAAKFYSVASVSSIDIFEPDYTDGMPVWIDGDSSLLNDLHGLNSKASESSGELRDKFILPQLLLRRVLGRSNVFRADLSSLRMGLS